MKTTPFIQRYSNAEPTIGSFFREGIWANNGLGSNNPECTLHTARVILIEQRTDCQTQRQLDTSGIGNGMRPTSSVLGEYDGCVGLALALNSQEISSCMGEAVPKVPLEYVSYRRPSRAMSCDAIAGLATHLTGKESLITGLQHARKTSDRYVAG